MYNDNYMPTKTVYVAEGDLPLWVNVQRESRQSVSALISDCLRRHSLGITISDLPNDVLAALEAAAKSQGQSRHDYVRHKLIREYGAEGNQTTAITNRLRDLLSTLSNCVTYHLAPTPTIAHIAESLGFESTAPMDHLLRGDRPLTFAEADRICGLFGINRRWLLEGSEHRFGMPPVFEDPWHLLQSIVLDKLRWGQDNRYEELVFVFPAADFCYTGVFGRRDKSGYRVDLLLNGVPLYGRTGGGGQRLIFDFCLLAAAVSAEASTKGSLSLRVATPRASSFISKTVEEHSALLWGDVHLGCAHRNLNQSTWLEDIWDLEYTKSHRYYPEVWQEVYRDFKIIAELDHGITDNRQLFDFLEKEIGRIRKRAAEEAQFEAQFKRRIGTENE